jgi:hypothetical protein
MKANIKPTQTEKIIRKTIQYELIERPTKRGPYKKRGYKSTVQKKMWYLLEQLWLEGYHDTIPHKVFTIKVMDICGCDRTTVRAYLGYKGRIRRKKRTGEGYIQGIPRKGYFEIFGLARREGPIWYLFHENVPTFPYRYVESLEPFSECQREGLEQKVNVKKISLTQATEVVEAKESVGEAIASTITTKHNNIPREREIFDLQPQLNCEEQAILQISAPQRSASRECEAHG